MQRLRLLPHKTVVPIQHRKVSMHFYRGKNDSLTVVKYSVCVARLVYQTHGRKSTKTLNWTITLCENDTPQIEQYPSVRTICPGEGCREHPKKQKCRCGNGSVAAAFLWPDSEKALKSRAFRQKEKVGNFYQNYLPFMAKECYFDKMKVIVIYWYDLYLPGRTAIKHLPKIGELWYTHLVNSGFIEDLTIDFQLVETVVCFYVKMHKRT